MVASTRNGTSRSAGTRSGSGIRLTGPRKNDAAAMNSATDIRQRWRFNRAAPCSPPARIIRRSPAPADKASAPKISKGGANRLAAAALTTADPMLPAPSANAASIAPRSTDGDRSDRGCTASRPVKTR